ncbi:carbon-nitrogen family hydrolase [Sporolactobacillus sp. Y61]|jgi:predicted amidohydrolase|uniref:Carbon-nitrogen family hydrolase n=1 Tax=Sporolactobacillus sp. Y61 TaxID=3160863 RepID=A0AAU8IF27_9BACL|nr:carbon-nitrogen family hydrolase [Sporolactobacillus sp. THM19-2]RYL88904.1 carbon-nitrogen family hydrolase [Sporolactobacillus sp. THM19-2]
MKAAIIQLNIAFGNPDQNLEHAEHLISEALKDHPDVIILPELWTTGYDLEHLNRTADSEGKAIRRAAGRLAGKHHVNLIAGSTAVKTDKGIFNRMAVFNREGTCIKTYDKIHLFRLMREERFLKAGRRDGLFQIDGVLSAGFICYDIRFPEWIRKHVLAGAKMLFIPAEWPKPRLDHWRTLLTCRAIENQVYVVACNRAGSDPDNHFAGHSLVIGPWGDILAEADENEGILSVDLPLSAVEEVRSRIPVFEDRRPEIY